MSNLAEQEPQPGAVQDYFQGVVARFGDLALRIAAVALLALACLELSAVKASIDSQPRQSAADPDTFNAMAEPPGTTRIEIVSRMDKISAELTELKAAVCATGARQDYRSLEACSVAP